MGDRRTSLILVLVLCFVVVSIPQIRLVKAQSTIYIRADGSVEGTDKIQRDGNIYTFTGDIYSSIVVEKNAIVIDGLGYTLEGIGNETGISLTGRENVTIKSLQIKNFAFGIWLKNSSNNTILENNITNNNWYSIFLEKSSNNSISGNTIENSEVGIYILRTSHNVLSNNSINNNNYNLKVEDGFIISVDSSNTINGKAIYYWVNQQDRTVPSNAGYVALVNCKNITVQNQKLSNNQQGILLSNTTNSTITKNTITNTTFGIDFYSSSHNSIIENSITNNDVGISLRIDSNNNLVSGNNITINNVRGIQIESDNNSIIGNNLINNSQGIYVYFADNSIIYHNNFINNLKQVYDIWWSQPWIPVASVNQWDNESEGNYWSNYNGTDNDGDGIGDTPYIIDENNQDNYPLMEPMESYVIPEFPSWIILPLIMIAALAVIALKKTMKRI